MSLVLAFDTSGAYCAAALLEGDQIQAHRHEDMAKGQVERLMPLLEETLAAAGKTWADLDRIGVGIGPGNFTGIRIAVSAARGLALALGIPTVGVSALEAQAFGHTQLGAVLSVLDARQGRLYSQTFSDGRGAASSPSMCLPEEISAAFSQENLGVIGHCSGEIADRLSATKLEQSPEQFMEAIVRIAAARTPDGTRPAPLYLRPADAAPPKDPAPVIL